MTREDMRRFLRRYDFKSAVFVILGGLLWLGILRALFLLSQYSEVFRNPVGTLILRLPWLVAGFIAGVIVAERDAKREEQARERMFPGRREQNREYAAFRLLEVGMWRR